MGNKTIESPKFKKTVEDVLDALATLYSVSQRVFMLEFPSIPKDVLHEMVRLRFTKKYNGTPLEDTIWALGMVPGKVAIIAFMLPQIPP